MMFQRKSAGKAKQQTPAKSKKSFSEVNDLDEMDNQVMKTRGKTPKSKQAQHDKRVSFQIPGKNTPSNKETPKGAVVGKKQATPAKVGSLKAFGGIAANSASKRNGKAKKAASDEEEDSKEDDDEDDDSDTEGADLDMLLAGDSEDEEDDDEDKGEKAPKNKKTAKTNVLSLKKNAVKDDDDDDDDEDEDDDDDDDDEDDDDEDDDGDDDKFAYYDKLHTGHSEDDNEEELPKNKQNPKQQNQSKNAQIKDSTPGQNKNAKQMEKSHVKKAVLPKKTEKKEVNLIVKNFVELDTQRRRERDARTLYVGNLPKDIVATELKALSSDILAVNLPNHQKNKRSLFAFLEFASESKAEDNFNILKSKKLRGEPLTIDYAGEKSLKRKPTELPSKDFNLKKLYVPDIPTDGSMDQVAGLFPKSIQISLAVRPTFKSATILFSDEKDAAEAIEAAKSAKIGSKPITVVYSIQRDGGNKKKRKRSNKGKQQNQAGAKKMKLEVDSDDNDDDDEVEE